MRSILFATLFVVGCGTGTGEYTSALTGQTCDPNGSYKPKKAKAPATNDKCQGTSNGDNCDDLSSGQIDCIGDGNSGQGDDKKHNCVFPQPGCDDVGCCEDDLVGETPDPSNPEDPEDPQDPGDPSDPTDPTGPNEPADGDGTGDGPIL